VIEGYSTPKKERKKERKKDGNQGPQKNEPLSPGFKDSIRERLQHLWMRPRGRAWHCQGWIILWQGWDVDGRQPQARSCSSGTEHIRHSTCQRPATLSCLSALRFTTDDNRGSATAILNAVVPLPSSNAIDHTELRSRTVRVGIKICIGLATSMSMPRNGLSMNAHGGFWTASVTRIWIRILASSVI